MKFFTQNVRGFSDPVSRRRAFTELKRIGPDVAVLTETKALPRDFGEYRNGYGQYMNEENVFLDCFEGEHRARGVALLFKPGLQHSVISTRASGQGYYFCATVEIYSEKFLIAAVYGDASTNDVLSSNIYKSLLHDITELYRNDAPQHLILAGDFNVVLSNHDLLNSATRRHKPRTEAALLNIIEQYSLEDLWLEISPDDSGFTYHAAPFDILTQKYKNTASRLDRIYVSDNVTIEPLIATNVGITNSDHMGLTAQLRTMEKSAKSFRHPDYLIRSNAS